MIRSLTALAAVTLTAVPFPTAAAQRAELCVPAFTAYVLPNADAEPVAVNRPLMAFAQSGNSLAWFGLFVSNGRLEATGTSFTRVLSDTPPTIVLPPTVNSAALMRQRACKWTTFIAVAQ